ncbi:TonB-dependent receptor [Horticoccus luteus]|uniref:TonB-dependent receptor n=1 Tax=Horticoccus luteus TaxID=2862869 RepID=A0A8F9TWD4_9BACT|nr:TonB-dependent receptor [Horticoccus luteus]QYM78978.1 TonB-dependent receptor [Horticoccus luteus]
MKSRHPILRWFGLGSFLAATVLAQTPAAAPAAHADDDSSDEITTLPEFSVTETTPSDYMAAESTTGTRVASKIKDLPFSVNVVTGEFMDDFNALEFGDQFAYTSNVIAYETISTGYSVRGFEADVQLRNGFRRIGLIDKVNVDRAEVIKGPAASIYGATLPGGIVNIVTKKPKAKPEYRVGFSVGSKDALRAQASATGPVGTSKNVFYRVDVADDQRAYDQAYKHKEQYTGAVQLQWKPNAATSWLFEAERLVRNEEANANTPFVIQPGTPDPYRKPTNSGPRTYNRYVGLATNLLEFNVQGPLNYSKRYVNTLTATFERRISDVFSFRSSVNWFDRDLERQEVAGRDQYNPVTKRLSNSTSYVPRLRPFGEGGAGWQNDMLAAFDTGAVKHKLLITLDWQRQTEQPQQFNGSIASFPGDSTVLANGLDPANPDYRFYTFSEKPGTYTASQNEDNVLDVYGLFVSERASFWNGRVIALVGGRYDSVFNHSRTLPLYRASSATNAAYVADIEQRTHSLTYQTGVNFQIIPQLTAYVNASSSFVPQLGFGTNPVTYQQFALPNETGEGHEFGLKGSFLHDRLTFTLGYFDITRHNIARDATDSTTGTAITYLSGEEAAKGYELDYNWSVTPSLQFFGGLGKTESIVVSNATARHLIGTSTRRTPEYTVGLGTKYEFKDGGLKGLYLTAGFKYNSESLINPSTGRNLNATASNPVLNKRLPNGLLINPDMPEDAVMTTGSYRVDDGREAIFNAPFHVWDAGIGYKFRLRNRRFRHKVQVNVVNVFDDVYTYGSGGLGPRRGVTFTYDLTF